VSSLNNFPSRIVTESGRETRQDTSAFMVRPTRVALCRNKTSGSQWLTQSYCKFNVRYNSFIYLTGKIIIIVGNIKNKLLNFTGIPDETE